MLHLLKNVSWSYFIVFMDLIFHSAYSLWHYSRKTPVRGGISSTWGPGQVSYAGLRAIMYAVYYTHILLKRIYHQAWGSWPSCHPKAASARVLTAEALWSTRSVEHIILLQKNILRYISRSFGARFDQWILPGRKWPVQHSSLFKAAKEVVTLCRLLLCGVCNHMSLMESVGR